MCLLSARWPLGTILALFSAAIMTAASGVWQLLVRLAERRLRLNPILRTVAYLFPFIAMVGLPLAGFKPPQPANKRYPAESPSGEYTARVSAPGEYWTVTIKGKDGSSFTEDTNFVGHLNVYWCWDESERLWVYNSDDGQLHYWQHDDSTWKHVEMGSTSDVLSSSGSKPPADLLPDYARK